MSITPGDKDKWRFPCFSHSFLISWSSLCLPLLFPKHLPDPLWRKRLCVCVCVCVCVCARVHAWVWLLSHVWFFMTPWTNCGPSDSSVCGIFWAQMANWRPFFPFLSKHTQIIVKATYLTKMMREKINIKDMKTYNSLHSCQWSPYIFILSWNALTKGKGRLTDFWPPPKQEVIFLIYW